MGSRFTELFIVGMSVQRPPGYAFHQLASAAPAVFVGWTVDHTDVVILNKPGTLIHREKYEQDENKVTSGFH
jgi:hypothetical protein